MVGVPFGLALHHSAALFLCRTAKQANLATPPWWLQKSSRRCCCAAALCKRMCCCSTEALGVLSLHMVSVFVHAGCLRAALLPPYVAAGCAPIALAQQQLQDRCANWPLGGCAEGAAGVLAAAERAFKTSMQHA